MFSENFLLIKSKQILADSLINFTRNQLISTIADLESM